MSGLNVNLLQLLNFLYMVSSLLVLIRTCGVVFCRKCLEPRVPVMNLTIRPNPIYKHVNKSKKT